MRYRSSIGVPAAGTVGFALCSFSVLFEAGFPYYVSSRLLVCLVTSRYAFPDSAYSSHPVLLAHNFGRLVLLDVEFVGFSLHSFSDFGSLCAETAA